MDFVCNIHLNHILEPLRLGWWRDQRIYPDIPNAAITPSHVWAGGRGEVLILSVGQKSLTLKYNHHLWCTNQSPRFTGLWRYKALGFSLQIGHTPWSKVDAHTHACAHNLLIYWRSLETSASGTKTVLVLGSPGIFPKHFCLSDHIYKSQPIGVFARISYDNE